MPQALLSARGITRVIGPRTILDDVALDVDDGARIGLIGPNGSGKSTLMRVLAGVEPPDAGRVVLARDAGVLYLPQLDGHDATPLRVALHELLGVATAGARMDALAARLAAGELELVDDHAAALQRWLACGGDDIDVRLDRGAARAGLDPELLTRSGVELSGGQRARAMLAAVSAARADVLLLDEPANHLDDDGLERLRTLLLARSGGVVLVAHDRALLAAVCDRVVELDPHTGRARTLELEIRDGERVLLAGPNGCGKSTVIAALTGRLTPSSGRARHTAAFEVGQERATLLGGEGPLVSVTRAVAGLDERGARAALAAIGLDSEAVQLPVATLSPGERTRAELAAATAAGARLLLLDEPTNHLDVEALEALEGVLADGPGALVVATHDARLRDALRIDRTLELTAR